jgi:transcriptional regulator with XRE-family HTH domain
MTFRELAENLRSELLARIRNGEMTQSSLARRTGFRQAHISNYLSGRRALSLQGLDRVLLAQNLVVDDLISEPPHNFQASAESAAAASHSPSATESVPVVDQPRQLTERRISSSATREVIECPADVLRNLRTDAPPERLLWQRFAAIRFSAEMALSMHPLFPMGCLAVIDRHYTALEPYHDGHRNIYAVWADDSLHVASIEPQNGGLVLRPNNVAVPTVMLISKPNRPSPIAGRLCWALSEL